MQIIYPYNEILPKKTAHDVYIFQSCAYLAKAGAFVDLLIGKGSKEDSSLLQHYHTSSSASFHIQRLPIIRKNNPLHLSWNFPFFFCCQRYIEKHPPKVVLLSVEKQARFHLHRKRPFCKYVYEVHQLRHYLNSREIPSAFEQEQKMLSQADLITVTTESLKNILLSPPYALKVPIEVIHLAVRAKSLPPLTTPSAQPIFAYVGQLYREQGIEFFLEAFREIPSGIFRIIGGKPLEIERLKKRCIELNIQERVEFLGFHPPSTLPSLLHDVHFFVAPFLAEERMPYVAHTKLLEYASWGRPIIAPNLPVVKEHFFADQGLLLFEEGSLSSLHHILQEASKRLLWEKKYDEIQQYREKFNWEKRSRHYLDILSSLR